MAASYATRRALHSLGETVPPCLGHYLRYDDQCDGAVPCAWKNACRIYRDSCEARKVDPELERGVLDDKGLRHLVFRLMNIYRPEDRRTVPREVLAGWTRFKDALNGELRASMRLRPMREFTYRGELYERAWMRKGDPVAWVVRAHLRNSPHADPAIARYWLHGRRRVEPKIELRCDLDWLLATFPQVEGMALRWVADSKGRSWITPLGTTAVRVRPEHIGDFGRLVARIMEANALTGLRWTGRRLYLKGDKEGEA